MRVWGAAMEPFFIFSSIEKIVEECAYSYEKRRRSHGYQLQKSSLVSILMCACLIVKHMLWEQVCGELVHWVFDLIN